MRIKTEKEFIREFGINWRHSLSIGFPEEMNVFFNRKLTVDQTNHLNDFKSVRLRSLNYTWTINRQMIVDDKFSKYKDRLCG